MTPEGKVKKKVVEILKKHGAYIVSVVTGGYGKNGVPDIIFCYKGMFVAIECKATNKENTTALQDRNMLDIIRAGGKAWRIDGDNVHILPILLKECFG